MIWQAGQQLLNSRSLMAARGAEYIRWYPKSLTVGAWPPATPRSAVEGVYVHVPFCTEICPFCPFVKRVGDSELRSMYLDSLLAEIKLWAERVRGPLDFVYFGGGTPSTLTASQIGAVLSALDRHLTLSDTAEITLETHPSHAEPRRISDFVAAGVNRISTGIQSFDDRMLRSLGSYHDAGIAQRAVETIVEAVGGVAIDLLYRGAGQTLTDFETDLVHAVSSPGVDHISLYSLVLPNESTLPPPETDVEMAAMGVAMLESEGFEHYASCATGGFDLARPGAQCVYEFRHWASPQASYIGLGPGALGFVASGVSINCPTLSVWRDRLDNGLLPLVSWTEVGEAEHLHRSFVLGTKALAVDLSPLPEAKLSPTWPEIEQAIRRLEARGQAVWDGRRFALTDLGRLMVDQVSCEFFSSAEREVAHPEEPEIRSAEAGARAAWVNKGGEAR